MVGFIRSVLSSKIIEKKGENVTYYMTLGIVSLLIFIPIFMFIEKKLFLAYSHIAILCLILIANFLYFFFKKPAILIHTLCFSAITSEYFMLLHGELARASIFFTFPVIYFIIFLTNKKSGIIWLVFFFVLLATIPIVQLMQLIPNLYPLLYYIVYLLALVITIFFLLTYTYERDKAEGLIIQTNSQFLESNQKLMEEIQNKENLSKQLKERTGELEKINQFMLDRELRIMDLKKQSEQLQKELALLKGQSIT